MTGQWGGGGGGSSSLAGDSDVTLTGLTALDQLQYNGSNWINARGGMVRLGRVAPGSSVATLAFASIPATYSSLIVHIYARGDTNNTASSLNVQFNGDAGANYDYMYQENAVGTGASLAQTLARIGTMPALTSTAGAFDTTVLTMPSYAGTVGWKAFVAQGMRLDTTAAIALSNVAGNYRSTAAISSLTLLPGAGNFIVGTVATLYGLAT